MLKKTIENAKAITIQEYDRGKVFAEQQMRGTERLEHNGSLLENLFWIILPYIAFVMIDYVLKIKNPGWVGDKINIVIDKVLGLYINLVNSIMVTTLTVVVIASVLYYIIKQLNLKPVYERILTIIVLVLYSTIIYSNITPNFPEPQADVIELFDELGKAIKDWLVLLLLLFSQMYVITSWLYSKKLGKNILLIYLIAVNVVFFSSISLLGWGIQSVPMLPDVVDSITSATVCFLNMAFSAIVFTYMFMLTAASNVGKILVDKMLTKSFEKRAAKLAENLANVIQKESLEPEEVDGDKDEYEDEETAVTPSQEYSAPTKNSLGMEFVKIGIIATLFLFVFASQPLFGGVLAVFLSTFSVLVKK